MNSIGMAFIEIKPGTMVVGKFQPTTSKFGFLNNTEEINRMDMVLPALPDSDFKLSDELSNKRLFQDSVLPFQKHI
ncbi:MAG: hypothetical protein U5K54_23915 [Cytophagales bacterium]|nr:hypothetical protein [Cytophagales bacterium]